MICLRRSIVVTALVWLLGDFSLEAVLAWEVDTHQAISQEAINASDINRVLRENLGLESGLGSRLRDGNEEQTIDRWIANIGSRREDDFTIFPAGRFLNHFHHPLRPWDQAGLDDSVLGIPFSGVSSAVWAQTPNQQAGSTGSWSWQETRDRFYLALTSF